LQGVSELSQALLDIKGLSEGKIQKILEAGLLDALCLL
jgi:hypothetical protein